MMQTCKEQPGKTSMDYRLFFSAARRVFSSTL
jgi:hypothetical protein